MTSTAISFSRPTLTLLALAAACTLASAADQPVIGLITKTDTNPFFVKMKEGAQAAATAKGAKLLTAAGKVDGDNAGQVTAILAAQNSAARNAKFSTPEAVMLGMKTGELDQQEGNALLQKMRGKGSVVKPLAPPR